MRGKISILVVVITVCVMLNVHLTAMRPASIDDSSAAKQLTTIVDKANTPTILKSGYNVASKSRKNVLAVFGYED